MKQLISACYAFLGLIASNGFAMTWDQLLISYNAILVESILPKQHFSYVSGKSPTIADSRVKLISFVGNEEELIDLWDLINERIQMLPTPNSPFEQPFFNSGLPNASKMRKGLYDKLQDMIVSLDRLSSAFEYKPGQICIRIFEGLRDLNTQSMLFQKKLEEILLIHPHLTLEEAELETAKWVSPVKNNIPVHSTGAAIDIRLWDIHKNEFVDMGIFGVIWGTNDTAPTFSENISDEQKKNRLYCLIAAEQAGLTNYSYEFWHFSSKDRYAKYWENEKDHNF